ncbi:hypothetical protein THAOC_00498, partial [Thalassiosira oceanica]
MSNPVDNSKTRPGVETRASVRLPNREIDDTFEISDFPASLQPVLSKAFDTNGDGTIAANELADGALAYIKTTTFGSTILAVNLAKDMTVSGGNILTNKKSGEALKVQPASLQLSPIEGTERRRLPDGSTDQRMILGAVGVAVKIDTPDGYEAIVPTSLHVNKNDDSITLNGGADLVWTLYPDESCGTSVDADSRELEESSSLKNNNGETYYKVTKTLNNKIAAQLNSMSQDIEKEFQNAEKGLHSLEKDMSKESSVSQSKESYMAQGKESSVLQSNLDESINESAGNDPEQRVFHFPEQRVFHGPGQRISDGPTRGELAAA